MTGRRPTILLSRGIAAAATILAVAVGAQEAPPAPAISFEAFLADVRAQAEAAGISAATLDRALGGLEPEPVVVSRDRTQPEAVQSLDEYVAQRVSRQRVQTARQMAARHTAVLARVEAAYGVPKAVLVAIWGLESNFGRFTGTYPTIPALATLAWDDRRPLFRTQLIAALRMVDRGTVTPEEMRGSWAGAMGQPQFMPTSFLDHAVDFDGDGRIDIWTSLDDVFGSMANYLRDAGWAAGERWGREVRMSADVLDRIDQAIPMRTEGCRALQTMSEPRPLPEWQAHGVRLTLGAALPDSTMPASLVRGVRRHFLVYRNYEALIDYNCAHSYALSVALLSDRVWGY